MFILRDKDFLGALIFLAISLICLLGGYNLAAGTLSAPGPGLFPRALSSLLAILSIVLLLKSWRIQSAEEESSSTEKSRWMKVILALSGLIAYICLLDFLGYLICSFLILILLLRAVEGCTWKSTLTITLSCAVISYVVFARYLGIPLPRGIVPF